MSDQFDEEAEALLLCGCGETEGFKPPSHVLHCAANCRPAVAARLRARDAAFAMCLSDLHDEIADLYRKLTLAQTEIERLKAIARDNAAHIIDQATQIAALRALLAEARMALEMIAAWKFNFMGDCVADARRVANACLAAYHAISTTQK